MCKKGSEEKRAIRKRQKCLGPGWTQSTKRKNAPNYFLSRGREFLIRVRKIYYFGGTKVNCFLYGKRGGN